MLKHLNVFMLIFLNLIFIKGKLYGDRTPLVAKHPLWRDGVPSAKKLTLCDTEKRIYDKNGNIEIEDVPFLVSISHKDSHQCGGSIIKNDVILTAAHCVKGYTAEDLKIRAGSSFNYTDGIVVNATKFISHPNYNNEVKDSDVALIWLAEPLVFSDVIKPIALTKSGHDVDTGTMMSVSGFGHDETYKFTDTLQAVLVPVVDQTVCDENYTYRRITANMMCAGYETGGSDACLFDSGGPLVHNGTQYGVVSFGRGCAEARYPGVYARISTLRPWIDAQLDKENEVKEKKVVE